MEEVHPFKETFLMSSFKVVLPTMDVYSDIALATKLCIKQHYMWATSLLLPFLINYTLCWFAWFNYERQKKLSWIAPLLGCYPQLVALRIIWLFWTNPLKGMKEKKYHERNIMENEVFTEAVPSTLIMTFLVVVAKGSEEVN